MKVYIKNVYGQQTVRDISFFRAIHLRIACWYAFITQKQEEKPIIRFMI